MNRRTFWTLLLRLGVVALALPAVAHAQPFDLDTPPDSPLWWPVSVQTSSTDLRASYRDVEASLERYREAAAAGLVPARTQSELQGLKFYLNPRLTPDLETIWRPLTALAAAVVRDGADPGAIRRSLAEYGVSAEGSDQILMIVRQQGEEMERLVEEVGPKTRELILMHWEVLEREGRRAEIEDRLRQAVKQGDVSYFVEHTDRPREEIEELLREGPRQPSAIAGEVALRRLRQELQEEDWQGLRRYLAGVVVDLGDFMDF